MEQKNLNQKKWYDKNSLLILSLLFFYPIGLYGILKRKTSITKKVIAGLPAIFFLIIIITYSLTDYYKAGIENFEKKEYVKAIHNFELVTPSNKNYKDSRVKMRQINKIFLKQKKLKAKKMDSIEKINLDLTKKKIIRLKAFQKKWADSVVKSFEGLFILKSSIESNSIKFTFSKQATKAFIANVNTWQPMLKKSYQKGLKKHNSVTDLETTINFIPHPLLAKNHIKSEWKRPTFKNYGTKIYSGNRYDKQYLGTISCKYKSNPNDYYVKIVNSKGHSYELTRYEFLEQCWVKVSDEKTTIGNELGYCVY
ncbi:hypothetical protein ACXGQW_00350 [Wenyingzhuangia sp. IMCC45533]